MKRIVVVLAVALILTMTVWDAAGARQYPMNYKGPNVRPGGEDHPWGGEQGANPKDYPFLSLSGTHAPGYFLVDVLFTRLTDYLKQSRQGTLNINGSGRTIDDDTKDIPKVNTKGN